MTEIQGYLLQDGPDEMRFRTYPVGLALPSLIAGLRRAALMANKMPPDARFMVGFSNTEALLVAEALDQLKASLPIDVAVKVIVRAALGLAVVFALGATAWLALDPRDLAIDMVAAGITIGLALGSGALLVAAMLITRLKGKF